MQRTATQIMFPDAGDPNIPSLKKSNVIITGGIHNVYLARQQLVVGHVAAATRDSILLSGTNAGYLPVSLFSIVDFYQPFNRVHSSKMEDDGF